MHYVLPLAAVLLNSLAFSNAAKPVFFRQLGGDPT